MISRIRGLLRAVTPGEALLDVSGISYSILVSPSVEDSLVSGGRVGGEFEFSVYHYIEGNASIGNMIPRLAGFLTDDDRSFFLHLTSVQGLGVKKAMRALIIPTSIIAQAIEQNDIRTLQKLPEIGARTAQKIVLELKGKVTRFASIGGIAPKMIEPLAELAQEYQREAVEILKQLQYSEADAVETVRRVAAASPEITNAEGLIQEAFKRGKA
jgi:holliday junction DNA helicase RuvA